MKHWALIACVATATSGCLSTTHRISKQELTALAQTDPHTRGERVRVVQQFAGSEEPPDAPEVHSNTTVVVVAPVRVRGSTRVGGRTRAGGGSAGRVRGGNVASSKADDAKVWIILAAVAAVGLAATEGARYNGWVELHPMHPVHLRGPYGEYTWVPLAQLDPETAAWADRAWVRQGEGPWRPLGRAPLDRRGLTYSVLLGAAELPSFRGTEHTGFMSHIHFGIFPAQTVGVGLDIGLGWTDNSEGDTIFDSRWTGELQVLPFAAGPVHAGGFLGGGFAYRDEDGAKGDSRRSLILSGGALLQLELTTYLALTGRVGASRLFDELSTDATLGLSIY